MASYPLPPWLQPRGTDPASAFISAFHAGASVAGERARLQMQAQEFSTKLAVQQQQLEQESMRREQQLEITKAYHQAEVGLKQQQLDQAQQRVNLSAKTAAERFAAQREYDGLVQSGTSPDEAALKVGPRLFGSMSGFGAVANAVRERKMPFVPTKMNVGGTEMIQESPKRWAQVPATAQGGNLASSVIGPDGKPVVGIVADPRGHWHNVPRGTSTMGIRNLMNKLLTDNPSVSEYVAGEKDPATLEKGSMQQARYQRVKRQYDELQAELSKGQPSGGNAPAGTNATKRFRWDAATGKILPTDTTSTPSASPQYDLTGSDEEEE